MQDYVVEFPRKLALEIEEISQNIGPLWIKGDFPAAEELFRKQYELIRSCEERLPDGQRYHKGSPLHNWGVSILLQKNPQRFKDGYRKIFLAYIEDLLDFDNLDQVHSAPAYKALIGNPFIGEDLLERASRQVEERKSHHQIPKSPEDVLTIQLDDDTEGAISEITDSKPKMVFVVHGRNLKARHSMCTFLRSIGLHPITFDEVVLRAGKVFPYIGEILDTAFSLAQAVVVLMTPDDEGCLRAPFREPSDPSHETELTPQARLNVIFEAGLAMGGQFRERTILVELGRIRSFTDISGRLTVRLSNLVSKREDLINRLRLAGCPVDLSGDNWRNAGDFDSIIA